MKRIVGYKGNHLASRNIQSYTVKEHIYIYTKYLGFFSQIANFDKNCKDTIISSITPTPETCQILSEIVKIENFGFDFKDTTEA